MRAHVVRPVAEPRPPVGREDDAIVVRRQVLGHREPVDRARDPLLVHPERQDAPLDEVEPPLVAHGLRHDGVRAALRLDVPERKRRVRPREVVVVDRERLLEPVVVRPPRDALHHRREVRHVAPADQAGAVRQPVRMRVAGRSQQQGGRVHRAARHDDDGSLDPDEFAVASRSPRRRRGGRGRRSGGGWRARGSTA